MKANPVNLIQRVASRWMSAVSETKPVLDDDDLEALSEVERKDWDGYFYKMSYEVVSEESAAEGDVSDRGWEEEGSEKFDTLEDLLNDIDDKSWSEWSSSNPDGKRDWLISEDVENYSSGDRTTYHLWIMRKDGKPLSKEELRFINKKLHVR